MMVTALAKGRQDWVRQVWDNLRSWQDALRQHDGLYLRNSAGKLTYRNWARGCCWYSLGLVRTMQAAQTAGVILPDDLLEEVNDVLRWLLAQQRADGLWSNFIDEQAMLPDTSGSAGIAAAMTSLRGCCIVAAETWSTSSRTSTAISRIESQTLWRSQVLNKTFLL